MLIFPITNDYGLFISIVFDIWSKRISNNQNKYLPQSLIGKNIVGLRDNSWDHAAAKTMKTSKAFNSADLMQTYK